MLTRLFAAALVLGSIFVHAQNLSSQAPSQAQAKNDLAASSEPWKILPGQSADAASGVTPLDRLPADPSKIDQFRIAPNGRPFVLENPLEGAVSELEGQCFAIRSYVMARDSKDSDSTHLVSYSTCVPSNRYRVRKAVLHPSQIER